jgi:membrane-associated PAP2 superfamily phosphatase
LRHAWIPGGLFALVWIAFASGRADLWIADHLFFDAASRTWIGANTWWALDVIHTGGKWLVRLVGLAAIAALAATFLRPRLRQLRRATAFLVCALILCPATIGILQQATNVDCPRDLERYGGNRPYVPLFGDRPDNLAGSECYPGSHAGSGFALMSFYFVLLGRRPRLARRALAGAILVGTVFSFGQQARGAHFLSHDLTAVAIVWFLLLALYRRLLESSAPQGLRWIPGQGSVSYPEGVPPRGPDIGRRPATHPAHARGRRAGIRGVFQRVFRARVPVCPASPQWERGVGAGSRPVDAHQGDAEVGGLPGGVGSIHVDLPDLSP